MTRNEREERRKKERQKTIWFRTSSTEGNTPGSGDVDGQREMTHNTTTTKKVEFSSAQQNRIDFLGVFFPLPALSRSAHEVNLVESRKKEFFFFFTLVAACIHESKGRDSK